MRHGAVSDAISQIEKWHKEEAGASETMELGAAYLWTKKYSSSLAHYNRFNKAYPLQIASIYGMAGVAQWCLNDPHNAVRQWREGLQCDYADAAGGAQLPLLLFFASIVEPETFSRVEAESLLAERAECLNKITQRHLLRPTAGECQHVRAERRLQVRVAVELIKHDFSVRIALQLAAEAHSDPV